MAWTAAHSLEYLECPSLILSQDVEASPEAPPLGTVAALARQIRTTYSPPPGEESKPSDRLRVLIVGDPGDPTKGENLPGAREEALEVRRLLLDHRSGVEVTTLVITDLNDDQAELRDAARFIFRELGPDTPWHISRFFPGYQMRDRPPTPVRTLVRAQEIGFKEGLRYVYLGNVGGESNTQCPNCQRILIRRHGYWTPDNFIQDGRCPECGTAIAGVW